MEICYVLFEEERAFNLEDNHSYTGHLLRSFLLPNDAASSQGGDSASSRCGASASSQRGAKALGALGMGWPRDISRDEALQEGKRYAKTLYKMAFKFLKLNFPDYSWRTKLTLSSAARVHFPRLIAWIAWKSWLRKKAWTRRRPGTSSSRCFLT